MALWRSWRAVRLGVRMWGVMTAGMTGGGSYNGTRNGSLSHRAQNFVRKKRENSHWNAAEGCAVLHPQGHVHRTHKQPFPALLCPP